MSDESKISVGPLREDGTRRVHIEKPGGTSIGLTIAPKAAQSPNTKAQAEALKKKREGPTSPAPKPSEEHVAEVVAKGRKEKFGSFARNLGWSGLWKIFVLILLGLIAYELFTIAQYLEPEPPSRIRRGF